MKSTQLLSVVFSLIMFTGVTAGSTAFADSDDLEDLVENFCEMSVEQQSDFFTDYPDMVEYDEKLSTICDIADEDEREDALDDFILDVVLAREDVDDDMEDLKDEFDEFEDEANEDDAKVKDDRDETDDKDDKYGRHADLDDRLEHFCDMTTDEKRQFFEDHPRLEQFSDRLANYCDLSGDEREDAIDKFIAEHKDVIRDYMKEKIHDKVTDKMTDIRMNYDRFCSMSESDRAAEITDVAKLDRISKWCNMTPEEREDYKKEHHDDIKDKVSDRIRMSDMSPRLKAMIMDKHDISDEKREEIKMKYREKHGELTDERKSELNMKFKDHMTKIKIKMSDERRSAIHDRLADMKAFKAELRERASEMTDDEKQQLREEFIQKAKDMQLAWISPRTQITAGIDAAEVECREGFSLVMKASNGIPMCLKADTALKMIDRGLVVPAN
ncbi:ABC transporter substrate-binding protein [Nitrosopumilus ureiphilus]|uniref:ABC transporter substrate-binding protein n=1 Tax=Nitrosopumilus ureiphilus TaxID=1470067 RepID=A0A7D5RAA7_9ARCH|nr:ABC transporter substrate-binding protein [Nitrosopumilus ureiphilus]QLH05902.1 ABC transporter substrate-binding protein [Nitrosopumilus ureiphilus]